jgi:septum site-determining protein MinD
MGKAYLFISGKGGVGKSTLAAALAVTAADKGLRVVLVDGDIGLRSLDMMLGLQDRVLFDLSDLVNRRCSLDSALVWHPFYPTLRLLVGGQSARPGDFKQQDLKKILSTLRKRFDLVLIDGPAGLARGVRNFTPLADVVVIVTTSDPIAQRGAEKTASQLYPAGIRPSLIINRVDREAVSTGVLPQPGALSGSLDLPLLGVVEESAGLFAASLEGKTAAQTGEPEIRNALEDILARMSGEERPLPEFAPTRRNLLQRLWKWLED